MAVLDFSGWAFPEEARDREVEARAASLGKWTLPLLHRLMEALDLARGSGDKGDKVQRVMDFLAAPAKQSDVDLAAKEADKKDKERAKRERALAKKDKERAKKDKERAKKEKAKEKDGKRKEAGDKKGPPKKKAKREAESEAGSEAESEEEASGSEGGAPKAEDMEEDAAAEEPSAAQEGVDKAEEPAAPGAAASAAADAAEVEVDPALAVPRETLAADVNDLLSKLTKEEMETMTAKTVTTALQQKYGFSVRARKREIKEIAQEYVDGLPNTE